MSEEKRFLEGMDKMSLSEHPELQQAWRDGIGLQKNWFYSLKTLKLVDCDDIQPYAIPSHILACLSNLNELEVRDCKKVKVIFEMNDSEIMEAGSQLKKLTLVRLGELRKVWKMNDQGTLRRFHENLQQVLVRSCDSLETLFPLALAKNLKKLEQLEIEFCTKLREIVEEEEAPTSQATEKFVFPCLTSLKLFFLRQLTCFYHKTFTLECPALNDLSVRDCTKLELFQSVHIEDEGGSSSFTNNTQSLFSDIKAISNLEKLKIRGKHTLELRSRLRQYTEDLIYLNELEMGFDENEKPTLPFEILQKAPYLERMKLSSCNIVEEFLTQNPEIDEHGMLGHLKILKFFKVSKLQSIGSENSSWLNTIYDRLNELDVSHCPDLTAIVHSAVSFSSLKELFIRKCHGLKYLFSSTTAEKLRNLEVMIVLECKSMKEVVAKEEDQTTSGAIKFERLLKIALVSLSSLECFYSGNDTLELPSLIEVEIQECLKMELFSHGLTHAEHFRGISSSSDLKGELVFHKDLNGSLKRVLLQRDHLVLGDSPMLKEIWRKFVPVPDWCFCNLNSLVVEGCDFLSNAILPSHLLPFLSNLKELQVRNCNSVEAIFDDVRPASDPLSFGLKKLILEQLPSLKHIWDKDPHGRLCFPFLEEVLVDGCKSIEYLFPASVAKDRLQKLDVQSCEGLVLISAKDKATTEEAEKELCIFPCLMSLRLQDLPNLQRIYPGMHILEWPMLKELDVFRCQMLKSFVTNSSTDSRPESQDSSPIDEEQAFVSLQKVTPQLEKLWLTKEDVTMIEQRKLHVDLQRLDSLHLEGFHDESHEFSLVFCSKVPFPSFEKLWVVDSAFKEIFPATQRPDIDYTQILSQLNGLQLHSLSHLKSIGLEHSWMRPFLENLETLLVCSCNCLTNLTPSTVSFSNLIELNVKHCSGLRYLFTSSTAKTLRVLKKMHLENCESIEEIVAYEEAEEEKDEDADQDEDEEEENYDYVEEVKDYIIFEQLEILTLSSLPKLGSFSSGRSALEISSLEQLSFTQCPNVKVFRHCDKIQHCGLKVTIDGVDCEDDLNDVIYQETDEGIMTDSDDLSELRLTKEDATMIEQGKLHVDLQLLELLELGGFHDESDEFPFVFCSKVPFPSFEKLWLVNSAFKEIFPATQRPDIGYNKILSQLTGLRLDSLYQLVSIGLEHSWMRPFLENLMGLFVLECHCLTNLTPSTVSFSNLTELYVKDCGKLEYLFTSSTAKTLCKLKKMHVENCESIEEIVTEDYEDEDEGQIIFGKLEILNLSSLPKLQSFYSGSSTLNFPSLKDVSFTQSNGSMVFRQGDIVPNDLVCKIDEA